MGVSDMWALIRNGFRRVVGLIALAMGVALAMVAMNGLFIDHNLDLHNGLWGFILYATVMVSVGWYWVRGRKFKPDYAAGLDRAFDLKTPEQKVLALNWIVWGVRFIFLLTFTYLAWIAYWAMRAGVPVKNILVFSGIVAAGGYGWYRLNTRKYRKNPFIRYATARMLWLKMPCPTKDSIPPYLGEPKAYLAIMEFVVPSVDGARHVLIQATYTGDASVYMENKNSKTGVTAIIGGGMHEPVQHAARAMLNIASDSIGLMQPTKKFHLANENNIRFLIATQTHRYTIELSEAEVSNDSHPLHQFYLHIG